MASTLTILLIPLAAAAAEPDWPTVVRDGQWHLREAQSGGDATQSWSYGATTDIPFYGDWDGDGTATPGVYRDGHWFLSNTLGGDAEIQFYYGGRSGDFPLVGDWDGDGVDTVGIVREGEWHLRDANAGGPGDNVFVYGRVGPRGNDNAIIGDWDGDGVDTVGVVRGTTWHLRNANAGGDADVSFDYGSSSDWMTVQGGFAYTLRQDPADLAPTDAIRAWFPDMADKAIRVADCESGLNPEAVNPRGFHGLFQISEQYHRSAFEQVTGVSWDEGIHTSYYNAQYARDLYERVGDWSPWPVCGS